MTTHNSAASYIIITVLSLFAPATALLLPSQARDLHPDQLAGTWQGTLKPPGTTVRLVVKISRTSENTFIATLDSPDQGATGIPIDEVGLDGRNVRLTLKPLDSVFEGELAEDGNTIKGEWTQAGESLPLVLERIESVEVAKGPQEPAAMGLPVTMAGFSDEGVFYVHVNEERVGTIEFSWQPDGTFENSCAIDIGGRAEVHSLEIIPDQDGRWAHMTLETPPVGRVTLEREDSLARRTTKERVHTITIRSGTVLWENFSPALISLAVLSYGGRPMKHELSFGTIIMLAVLFHCDETLAGPATRPAEDQISVTGLAQHRKVIPLYYNCGGFLISNIKLPDLVITNNGTDVQRLQGIKVTGRNGKDVLVTYLVPTSEAEATSRNIARLVKKMVSDDELYRLEELFGAMNIPDPGFSGSFELGPSQSLCALLSRTLYVHYVGKTRITDLDVSLTFRTDSGQTVVPYHIVLTPYRNLGKYTFPIAGSVNIVNQPTNVVQHRASLYQEFAIDIWDLRFDADTKELSNSRANPKSLSDYYIYGRDVLAVGDVVEQGVVIAEVGNTGNSDAGHLHFHLMDSENFRTANGLPVMFENVPIQSMGLDIAESNALLHSEFFFWHVRAERQ